MPKPRELSGAATLLGSEVSINFGSAVAGLLLPIVGTITVVAARQLVTAAILTPLYRPTREKLAWRRSWPAVLLGLALVVMNLSFYESVGILGLGIAAVIEFLGPFALAVIGSRRLIDVLCALGALGGEVLLGEASGHLDAWGVVFALIAAGAWAAYIVLTRRVATSMPGVEGLTIASVVACVLLVPLALVLIDYGTMSPRAWWLLLALGVLSSAVPYSLDAFVLRRITARIYAVMTAFGPAIATGFGALVLGERFTLLQLGGIVLVCVSAIVAVGTQPGRPPSPLQPQPAAVAATTE